MLLVSAVICQQGTMRQNGDPGRSPLRGGQTHTQTDGELERRGPGPDPGRLPQSSGRLSEMRTKTFLINYLPSEDKTTKTNNSKDKNMITMLNILHVFLHIFTIEIDIL